MKRILQITFVSLFLFILFLVLTFPFSRLGPKIQASLENNLSNFLGLTVNCDLDNFDFSFPAGVQWKTLNCKTAVGPVLEIANGSLSFFPTQTLKGKMGKGNIQISTNLRYKKPPTYISAQFENVPVEKLSPLVLNFVHRENPLVPQDVKIEGNLQGKLTWPLKNLAKDKGSIDLRIDGLKLPSQNLIKQFGLSELAFTKAALRAELSSGKLNILDAALLSQHLSGKVEGQSDLQEDFFKSSANLSLKWKIQKSDALMSSGLGALIGSLPCPSPDSEGFCTRKITRLAELGIGMRP
jgi:type II secretion system protein N